MAWWLALRSQPRAAPLAAVSLAGAWRQRGDEAGGAGAVG